LRIHVSQRVVSYLKVDENCSLREQNCSDIVVRLGFHIQLLSYFHRSHRFLGFLCNVYVSLLLWCIWLVCMRNLIPEIQCNRLIVEGFYGVEICEEFLGGFLIGLSEALGMRVIEGPFIFSPDKFSLIHGGLGAL